MTWTATNSQQLAEHMAKQIDNIDVVVCVGTDKVVCDSLGPMVGSMLNNNMIKPIYVYGLQSSCLTALNVAQCYHDIRKLHSTSTILAVDAGVGDTDQLGKVQISNHGILPGLATNRQLPCIGDVGIVGIVATRDMQGFYEDSDHTRSRVEKLSQLIVKSIHIVQHTAHKV